MGVHIAHVVKSLILLKYPFAHALWLSRGKANSIRSGTKGRRKGAVVSQNQFFLTQRSLYLLVLNGREGGEDADADYWLRLIESFGAESPVSFAARSCIRRAVSSKSRRTCATRFTLIMWRALMLSEEMFPAWGPQPRLIEGTRPVL